MEPGFGASSAGTKDHAAARVYLGTKARSFKPGGPTRRFAKDLKFLLFGH